MDTQVGRMQTWRMSGHCPACGSLTTFSASNSWFRDYLICPGCPGGSVPRERALALILNEIRPTWRELSIHESSPSSTGASVLFAKEGKHYLASQYFPNQVPGQDVNGVRNENLENQTFPDECFDIVISMDVMEHVYHPDRVFSEVYRTLKPGGIYICTFPVRNYQVSGWERRFTLNDDGTRNDLKEPEIHGNPVSDEGSIVTVDYGYDLHKTIAQWALFDVRVSRFHDTYHGILGDFTEVVVCSKMTDQFHPTVPEMLSSAEMEISKLKRSLDQALNEMRTTRGQLEDIQNSTSWRLTAPVRKLFNLFRG